MSKKSKEDNDTPPESVLFIYSTIFAINTAINVAAHMDWIYHMLFQRTMSKTKHIAWPYHSFEKKSHPSLESYLYFPGFH